MHVTGYLMLKSWVHVYEENKQKSHDNFRLEKNFMQLSVIRNRIQIEYGLFLSDLIEYGHTFITFRKLPLRMKHLI